MPKISEFFGVSIYIYFREHGIAHFHAEYGGAKAVISISDASLLAGSLPARQLGLVTEWASLRRAELLRAWDQAQRHQAPDPIEPLS